MPELAEVEYYRKKWLPAKGQTVTSVKLQAAKRVFRDADAVAMSQRLRGACLGNAERHGKQICFVFEPTQWLGVHLGMTGQIAMEKASYQWGKHDHLILKMDSGSQLVFRDPRMFGRIRYAAGPLVPEWWRGLPPEPVSPAFTREHFETELGRRSKSPIKAVLLMQDSFPGIGNWMADEILWRSRIRPTVRAGQIGPGKRRELCQGIREVSYDALRVIGADWGCPPDSWLFPHRWRDGGRCPRTGRPLRRDVVGGRTTCWSPAWQRYGGKS